VTKQVDEPAANFLARFVVHAVVAVIEVEHLCEAERLGDRVVVALVVQHHFTRRGAAARLLVVRHADKTATVALAYELRHRAAGE
jgi:hypothetical protein